MAILLCNYIRRAHQGMYKDSESTDAITKHSLHYKLS